MRYKSILVMLTLIMLTFNVTPVSAVPVPLLDLSTLTRDADLIVIGRVAAVQEIEPTTINRGSQSLPAHLMRASLQTYRVLKGRSSQKVVFFDFVSPETFLGYRGIVTNQLGMFFLRSSSNRRYVVANPFYPFVVACQAVRQPSEGDDLDRVVAELAHVLVARETSLNERREAVHVLGTVKSPASVAALRRSARKGDTILRLEAIAALANLGDISILEIAADNLLNPPEGVDDYLLKNLALAIGAGIKDPQALPSLTHLLSAPDVIVRRSAARAIRRMRVKDDINALILMLGDSDREVRYEGVIGLSETTGQDEWGPSVTLFASEEERFLSHWRDWARNR
jgi:hypothetical protein